MRQARRARDQGDGGLEVGPLPQDCSWALTHTEPGDTKKKTGTNSREVIARVQCVKLVELATKETEALKLGRFLRTVVGRQLTLNRVIRKKTGANSREVFARVQCDKLVELATKEMEAFKLGRFLRSVVGR